jgi:glycolate oxidase FAD binding subunit
MFRTEPNTAEDVAGFLLECASKRESIELIGRNTKSGMAGPVTPADHTLSTAGLRRVLDYEARDLTISVEAGCLFSDLQKLLARNGQMIALDPPFAETATIGGVVASNSSGPLRRGYGTARDLVIGMRFATLAGKLVQAGGMVVKNVAGLDMGKMMIGSFGTLAAITSLNFRLHSLPEATETFLYLFPEVDDALQRRNLLLASVLQPVAVDLMSPAFALRFGRRGYLLAVRAAGHEAVLKRYRQELSDGELITGEEEAAFWRQIQESPADFLARQAEGVIVKVSSTLKGIAALPKTVAGAFISRAASGVTFFYFPAWNTAANWWQKVNEQGLTAAIDYAPNEIRSTQPLWAGFDHDREKNAFGMMEKVKQMFDPQRLLNAKRLYGRI